MASDERLGGHRSLSATFLCVLLVLRSSLWLTRSAAYANFVCNEEDQAIFCERDERC